MLVCLQSRAATKDELCLVHRYAVPSVTDTEVIKHTHSQTGK